MKTGAIVGVFSGLIMEVIRYLETGNPLVLETYTLTGGIGGMAIGGFLGLIKGAKEIDQNRKKQNLPDIEYLFPEGTIPAKILKVILR